MNMHIPYGVPRVGFTIYVSIAVVVLVVLGILAMAPTTTAGFEQFLAAVVGYGLIFAKDSKAKVFVYSDMARAHPWGMSVFMVLAAIINASFYTSMMLNLHAFPQRGSWMGLAACVVLAITPWLITSLLLLPFFGLQKLFSWFGFGVTKDKYQLRDK